jgi:hypothetical protein
MMRDLRSKRVTAVIPASLAAAKAEINRSRLFDLTNMRGVAVRKEATLGSLSARKSHRRRRRPRRRRDQSLPHILSSAGPEQPELL